MPPKNPEKNKNVHESAQELPLPAEDFKDTAHVYHELLLKMRSAAEQGRVLDLGKIEIKGTKDRDFEIEGLLIPEERPEFREIRSSIQVFTIDKTSRKLAALESFEIEKEEDISRDVPENVRMLVGSSNLITRFRNIGAGSATERGLEVLLQRLVEKYNIESMQEHNTETRLRWKAVNGKIISVDDTKYELNDTKKMMPDGPEKTKEISRLEKLLDFHKKEYARWRSIFGNKGKLGFKGEDEEYGTEKIITPKEKASEKLQPVDLKKYDLLVEKIRQTL